MNAIPVVLQRAALAEVNRLNADIQKVDAEIDEAHKRRSALLVERDELVRFLDAETTPAAAPTVKLTKRDPVGVRRLNGPAMNIGAGEQRPTRLRSNGETEMWFSRGHYSTVANKLNVGTRSAGSVWLTREEWAAVAEVAHEDRKLWKQRSRK